MSQQLTYPVSSEQIICVGLNHRTAPVELRERMSCALPDLNNLLQPAGNQLSELFCGRFANINEMTLLSTCNRLEVYAYVSAEAADPQALIVDFLMAMHGVKAASFVNYLYYRTGYDAVTHLCRVAAGLDSLVLGEPQILGQVTGAYVNAVEIVATGPVLSTLFQTAIRAGKRARTETAISRNPASMSSVAIAQAQKSIGDLHDQNVLVIGLGEMGQLTLKSLRARGIRKISVANRTRQRAEAAAAQWGYQVYNLAELPQALAAADVVISATGSLHPLIDAAVVRAAMAQRPGRELVLVDLAMPRDIDPAARALPGVRLFDVDDLQGSLDEALATRQQEIPRVEAIIAQEVAAFGAQLRQLMIKPLITDLRQKAEAIRERELQRTLRHLGDVDPQTWQHIQRLSRSLVNKLLHEPTVRLKAKADDGQSAEYVATVRHLFGLETSIENQST